MPVPAVGSAGDPTGPPRSTRRRLVPALGIGAVVVVILAAVGVYYYIQHPSAAQAAGSGGHRHRATAPPVAKGPVHVLSVSPADGATKVNGAAQVRVVFTEALSAASPMPTLSPAIKGSWQRSGNAAVFVPARGFSPRTKVTLRIPAGSTGVQSSGGGLLAAPVTVRFRTGTLSRARLEQLLAQLGYLPLTWAPTSGQAAPLGDASAQLAAAYSPPTGTYTWQSGYPIQLRRLWRPDRPSEILLGAVMAFQSDHGLALDGTIGPAVWHAMFRALSRGQLNKHGYTYALARQKLPETLTVWHNGTIVFRHLANTGIPIRPTAVRTDPVYLRYQSQIMRGTNPDGSKYADPVAWVAYFHGGEAVHYFPRYSYGTPQSLGCVELPYEPAKRVWPYLTFGTLVTVTAP
jgi:peptidoglycan hydrolase-like protein with peptidoglycan-binding domain